MTRKVFNFSFKKLNLNFINNLWFQSWKKKNQLQNIFCVDVIFFPMMPRGKRRVPMLWILTRPNKSVNKQTRRNECFCIWMKHQNFCVQTPKFWCFKSTSKISRNCWKSRIFPTKMKTGERHFKPWQGVMFVCFLFEWCGCRKRSSCSFQRYWAERKTKNGSVNISGFTLWQHKHKQTKLDPNFMSLFFLKIGKKIYTEVKEIKRDEK